MNNPNRQSLTLIRRSAVTCICLALIGCGSGSSDVSDGSFLNDGATNQIAAADLVTEGVRVDTGTGFSSEGKLVMVTNGQTTEFENSTLDVVVSDDGTVIDMRGSTDVPTNLSNDVKIEGNVKSILDVMTGAEANLIDEIDIWLKEDRQYFVYYVGSEFRLIHTGIDGVEGSTVTLRPPLGGSILLISDPTDSFFYTQAASDALGGYGSGDSRQGLIPFVPDLPYEPLDMFDGHDIEKVSDLGIGVKVFDVMSFTGTKVIRSMQKSQVNLDRALDVQLEYKAGFNGSTKVDLAVLGVGFFEFDVATASATISVDENRQQMAMQTLVEPDVSWAPGWLPILPSSRTQGDWMINGDGTFEANLESIYSSKLPKAQLFGSMRLNNEGVTLEARDSTGPQALGVRAMFRNNLTSVEVDVAADFDPGIEEGVIDALDQELANVTDWTGKLQKRTENYDLEVSLSGLRKQLPIIADNAISTLNAIPDRVRTSVDAGVVATINSNKTLDFFYSKKATNSLGDSMGASAKNSARSKVNSMIPVMQNLKFQALQGDDAALRAALKASLDAAYNNRTFSQNYKFTQKVLGKNYTLYNKTETHVVIPGDKATQIKAASGNVHKIKETSDLKIEAEIILGDLREEDAIELAKSRVREGLAIIPSLDGVGYTVFEDEYTAYIVLNGKNYGTDVNALDKGALYEAIFGKMGELTD